MNVFNRRPWSTWRMAASENGLDREVALLVARFLPKVGVKGRALAHVGVIDALARAAPVKD